MSQEPTRTLDQVRETILSMPFAQSMKLDIESAGDGVGTVSMPLSAAVTHDGRAFAAFAIGTVADVAAGAATLLTLPPDEMALTAGIDANITASTVGSRLIARAELRERDDTTLMFDAVVTVTGTDGQQRECGAAVITMRVARPRQ